MGDSSFDDLLTGNKNASSYHLKFYWLSMPRSDWKSQRNNTGFIAQNSKEMGEERSNNLNFHWFEGSLGRKACMYISNKSPAMSSLLCLGRQHLDSVILPCSQQQLISTFRVQGERQSCSAVRQIENLILVVPAKKVGEKGNWWAMPWFYLTGYQSKSCVPSRRVQNDSLQTSIRRTKKHCSSYRS